MIQPFKIAKDKFVAPALIGDNYYKIEENRDKNNHYEIGDNNNKNDAWTVTEDQTFMFRVKTSWEKDFFITISGRTIPIPSRLGDLAAEIEESKYLLEFEDDWDDEGSKGYELSTWERAIQFLLNYSKRMLTNFGHVGLPPNICHGPDGSIDILWQTTGYRLLINIPENLETPASFYGDDFKNDKIKGTFDTSKYNMGLLMFLLASK